MPSLATVALASRHTLSGETLLSLTGVYVDKTEVYDVCGTWAAGSATLRETGGSLAKDTSEVTAAAVAATKRFENIFVPKSKVGAQQYCATKAQRHTSEYARRCYRKRLTGEGPGGAFETVGDESADKCRAEGLIDLSVTERRFEGQQLGGSEGPNRASSTSTARPMLDACGRIAALFARRRHLWAMVIMAGRLVHACTVRNI